jgi:serine/threonine protein phosphatase PrpC
MASVTFATATDKGCYSYNQDRAGVRRRDGGTIVSVCDGHGTYGEDAAEAALEYFSTAEYDYDEEYTPHDLFEGADNYVRARVERLLQEKQVLTRKNGGAIYDMAGTPIRGGTTASVVHIARNCSMVAAHVGDSEIRYYDGDGSADGVGLCEDHSPNNLEEFVRIRTSHPTSQFLFSSPHGLTTRPVFVPSEGAWAMNPAGGCQYSDVRHSWASYFVAAGAASREQLAMTRALGNFHLKRHGLIATPHVVGVNAPAAGVTRALVVASDGLWDACQYAAVGEIVRRPDLLGDAPAAAAALLDYGIKTSKKMFGGVAAHDNITVAVAYINVTGGAAGAGGNL